MLSVTYRSESTLPSMYTNFERAAREGEQFHRRHPSIASENLTTASPVSPTSYGPPTFSASKFQAPQPSQASQAPPPPPQAPQAPMPNTTNPYVAPLTPPESRKNSEDEKRQSLPSLREVGLAPPSTSTLNQAHSSGNHYHSHASLPPVHSLPTVQQCPPPPSHAHTNGYQHPTPHTNGYQHPPPPSHPSEQSRYDYHDGRNGYSQGPSHVHPNPEPYQPRQNSYPQPSAPQYPRPHPPSTHGSFSGPPPPPAHQFSHGPSQQTASNQPSYTPNSMQPPYGAPYHHESNGTPYHHESNGTHAPYPPGGSPTSTVLGKRPSTGYGGAIERALHVSSMRRDLENVCFDFPQYNNI